MDKETLSNYGWIVICVLVLAVMLALATPFGQFVSDAVWSTANGLFDTNQNALFAAGIDQVEETRYYSTIELALTDAQAMTMDNADSDKDSAVASNTTFECKPYSGECTDQTEIAKIAQYGAMYNGGTKTNAIAYMDNCKFINNEASYGLVVSTNYGFLAPTVYISNCNIKDFRIDGERADNVGQIGTAYIGKNVSYNLKSYLEQGNCDTTAYADAAFNTEWLKSQGIIE